MLTVLGSTGLVTACYISQWQKGLPIEVLPFAYKPVKLKLDAMSMGTAELRMAKQKAVGKLATGLSPDQLTRPRL